MELTLTANECVLLAQVIPVLLVVVGIGDGIYLRLKGGTFWRLFVTGAVIVAGLGEYFAMTGAITAGIESTYQALIATGAVFSLVAGVTFDLMHRIWTTR